MSYNPEYYGAPESQGIERSLLEGEINVVENIKNEADNKASLIKADEDNYPAIGVSANRDLFPEEINVVENIKKYDKNKSAIIKQDDEEVQMHELKQKINQLESSLSAKS